MRSSTQRILAPETSSGTCPVHSNARSTVLTLTTPPAIERLLPTSFSVKAHTTGLRRTLSFK
eukprot:scaffold7042_cov60-Phaeocystis_antarctica.AAC.6